VNQHTLQHLVQFQGGDQVGGGFAQGFRLLPVTAFSIQQPPHLFLGFFAGGDIVKYAQGSHNGSAGVVARGGIHHDVHSLPGGLEYHQFIDIPPAFCPAAGL